MLRESGRQQAAPLLLAGCAGIAQEQVAALAERAAAHVALDDPYAVARLRETGAQEQATALADRLPAAVCSACSSSREAARISSGSGASPTAAQPRHGPGKTWTDAAKFSHT